MPSALRDDLITSLLCTSPDRPCIIAELMASNPASVTYHAYRVLSNALRDAVDWQIVPANVAAAIAAPRVERPRLVIPDAEQVGLIVRAAEARSPYHVPIAIAATTGLRLGEVLGLTWSGSTSRPARCASSRRCSSSPASLSSSSRKPTGTGVRLPCRRRRSRC